MPNKVTKLTTLPLDPTACGIIYYTKPGKEGVRKHSVRPAKVKALFEQMQFPGSPYNDREMWDQSEAARIFVDTARRIIHNVQTGGHINSQEHTPHP